MIIALKITFILATLIVGFYCLFLAIGLQGWLKLPKLTFIRKKNTAPYYRW
ncbi:MAG: hypothetical protein M0D57_01945 [Sphingobacteriales bacterium JAD_PAG50586_3]|nr:MAG: hypothetical protein M0D57_01945 [Sphingobacteriales bacterium JAD_PAG50586_3]